MLFCGCKQAEGAYVYSQKGVTMKKKFETAVEQPKPFTPGVTRAAVRQRAYELFRDKLPEHPLTLEDWVLAEKDLVGLARRREFAEVKQRRLNSTALVWTKSP